MMLRPFSALLAWTALLAGVPAQQDGSPPARLALLVGIQDYPDEVLEGPEPFAPLGGPRNDIELVRRRLTERFGFAEDEVLVLLDQEATHEGIVRAFHEHLIERAGPETQVLFWYCGHGSRVPDASGVETLESSLVAWDSRLEGRRGSYDLNDDQLHSLIRALAAKTPYSLVVTDSCYSGGGTRGAMVARTGPSGSVAFDREAVAGFWPTTVPILDDDDPARGSAVRYVHVSASAADEQAYECDVESAGAEARRHGVLSYALTAAMSDARPGESLARIVARARSIARVLGSSQTIQLEGDVDRSLFAGSFADPLAGFPARIENGRLTVQAGRVHGIGPGAVFDLVGLDGETLGQARAQRVGTVTSRARAEGALAEVTGALRAILAAPATDRQPLRVTVEPTLGSDLGGWAESVTDQGDYRLRGSLDRWELVDRTDRVLASGSGASALDECLRREHGYRSLLEFAAQPGEYALSARFVAAQRTDLEGSGCDRLAPVQPLIPRGGGDAAVSGGAFTVETPDFRDGMPGELAVLEVGNESEHELFVTVLSIGENREVVQIWPDPGVRDAKLAAGSRRTIRLQLGADPDWRASETMGERYLVIGTRQYADFSPLTSEGMAAPMRSGTRLPGDLGSAIGAAPTRAGRSRWGTAVTDLRIRRR